MPRRQWLQIFVLILDAGRFVVRLQSKHTLSHVLSHNHTITSNHTHTYYHTQSHTHYHTQSRVASRACRRLRFVRTANSNDGSCSSRSSGASAGVLVYAAATSKEKGAVNNGVCLQGKGIPSLQKRCYLFSTEQCYRRMDTRHTPTRLHGLRMIYSGTGSEAHI